MNSKSDEMRCRERERELQSLSLSLARDDSEKATNPERSAVNSFRVDKF